MGDNAAGWEQLDYREEQRTDEGGCFVSIFYYTLLQQVYDTQCISDTLIVYLWYTEYLWESTR